MRIRKLKPTESGFLADMLYEAIFVPVGHDPLPKEIIQNKSLSTYIENWGKDKYDIALVAEIDSKMIGAAWGRLLTGKGKGYGYVNDLTPELSMAVFNAYRNLGTGTQLLKALIAEYHKIGVKQVSLSVDKLNAACNLYTRLGFQTIHQTEKSLTMVKGTI